MDMTGSFPDSLIGCWYWIGVVDYYSGYLWSFFTNTKLQLPKEMEEFFKKMTSLGTPVKYLSCDSALEHLSRLQKSYEKDKVVF